METADRQRHPFDFSKALKTVSKLEELLSCSGCGSSSVDGLQGQGVKVMGPCGHNICGSDVCGKAFRDREGLCPAKGCGVPVSTKDVISDVDLATKIEALAGIKALLLNPATLVDGPNHVFLDEKSSDVGDDDGGQARPTVASRDSAPTRKFFKKPLRSSLDDSAAVKAPPQRRVTMGKPANVVKKQRVVSSSAKMKPLPGKKPAKQGGADSSSVEVRSKPVSKAKAASGVDALSPESFLNVDKKNVRGETRLQCACIRGELERVKELLDAGADPNTRCNAGWTPLHEAAQRGFADTVKVLLERGANPNVPGAENVTPLHDAAQSGCLQAVRTLILHGADKFLRDSSGRLPGEVTEDMAMKKIIAETECQLSESEQLNCSLMAAAKRKHQEATAIAIHESVFQQGAGNGTEHLCATLSRDLVGDFERLAAKANNVKCDIVLRDQPKKLQHQQQHQPLSHLPEGTTHLVVGDVDPVSDQVIVHPGQQHLRNCYYEALLTGAWILSSDWIRECLRLAQEDLGLAEEEPFVVKGIGMTVPGAPRLSRRLVSEQLQPKLLDGMHIFLCGSFKDPYPQKAQLAELLRRGGATVLKREPDPEGIPESEKKVPFHAEADGPLAKCSHYIIYQEGDGEPVLKYNMEHLKSLPAAWLFACFDNYSIVEPFR